jgi:hypothetical protein
VRFSRHSVKSKTLYIKKNLAKSLSYINSVYKYVVLFLVFRGKKDGLVFFGYKQKAAYVLV